MVYFVNAISSPASFSIPLAALTPVQGVTWTYTGLPTIANSGVRFATADDSSITFTAYPGFVNNITSMTVRATLENTTTATATFNISSGSGATLPAISPLAVLSVTNGLVAQYDGPSWNGTTKVWLDKSGNGNNTSPADVRGVITYDSTNGFLYGGTGDGVKLPSLGTTANYTFIHLARYKDGAKKRIFQGVTENWASGFYDGKAGVAFHNGYITAATDLYGYNWVISSDQRNLYRAHSVDFTAGTAGSPGYPSRIGLNFGAATSEYSEWAVAEVLVYNRVLSASEMLSVENYLRVKYPSLTIQIDTTIGASFTIPQSNQSASIGSVNWTYKTPLPPGVTFSGSTQGGASFSIATGTFLNNQNLVVNASGNGGGGTRSLYLLSASRALLDTPTVAFDSSDAGSFTILQTASGTGGVTWAYSNLPASVTFLSSSDAGLTFAVAQNAVVSTRTLTVTATNGLKTPTVASFTYGSGVKPVLAVGAVSAIDSTSSSTFLVPQIVIDAFTGGITWAYDPPVFPAGLTVSATNQGATFTVAQNAVIAPQTITVTATNIGGVATSITFTVGAAVKPVLTFSNQLLNTATALKQFTITVQAPSVTYSGGITWSYTLPTGLTFVTSSDGLITFQAARSAVIPSQTFVVTATNSVGTSTAASFTLGAGTPPTLSDPTNGTGELIIDTTSVNRTFAVDQQSTRTGTIAWTVSPSSYPTGVSVQSTTNFGITMLLLQGSVLPYQPFTFTATATSGFVATRTFNVGASTLVELQGPGDPQLIDTTTQQTLQVSQIYDPTYTGPVTWTITPSTYPAGISITTQDDSKTIFTFNANSYLTRQQFVFTAQSIGGLTSTIRFDIGSAVRPTLSGLANQVLDTSTALKQFAVTQQVNTAYTGPIAWTVTPSPFPSGSGMTQVATDGLITFTVPVQTESTGVVWPNTPFSVTATNTNTGYSSFVPTTFNVFAPRLPVVNLVTPSSRILDVSTAAYTSITATQSKTDAVPVVWTITRGDNTAVPAGVSINSTSGLVTIAVGSYFVATTLKVIATNSAGAFGSTTFIVTTPAPPAINTVTPSTPQVLDVSDGPQTLTFTLTNSGLAGAVVWEYTPPTTGVTINSVTGDFAIAQYNYFTATSFTIKATNAASVTTQRVVSVTAPAVPTVTSLIVSPQVLEVSLGPKTIQFTQSTPLVGTVTWSYTPTTSGVTIDSNGLLTIAQGSYFAATTFTIKATNAVNKFGTMPMNITTPAPPVINTVTPTTPQTIDVSDVNQSFAFTNTASLTGTLTWSYTTSKTNVTIGQSTGVFDIAQGTYFTLTTFTIRVTNPVGIANTRLFVVTTPAPPVITGPTVPLGGRVVAGAGTGGSIPRVYVDNSTAFKTVRISQTESPTLTGTIEWNGITGLPTGVTLTPAPTNFALIFKIEQTTAVLRPAASAFVRANSATNPAGKASSTISYDVFTPQTPALGTLSPAPVPLPDGKIILDTSTTSQTITIPQTVAAANTDPLIWTVSFGGQPFTILSGNSIPVDLATVTASDTELTVLIPASSFVPDNTPVSVSVMNRADMSSGTTSFTLFVPQIAVFTQLATQYMNPSAGVATFILPQSKDITASGITYSTTPSLATLQASGITYSASGNGLIFTVAPGTIITSPGQSITVFGTNGAGVSAQTSFTVYAGNSPSLTAPPGAPLFLDTTTAKTIIVTNVGGAVETWITPTNFPTGVSFLSNTPYEYRISVAVDSIFASTDITVTGKNEFLRAGASTTFSVTGDKKPVVTTPGTQNLDTTTMAQSFIVYQTSGGTVAYDGWSITKGDLTAVPASITLTDETDTSVTVNIAQTTFLAATNVIVTATNAVDAGSTTFSLGAFYYVAPTVSFTRSVAEGAILVATSVNVATVAVTNPTEAGPCTFSVSPLPTASGASFSSTTLTYGAQSLIGPTTYTVTATGTGGSGTAQITLDETYFTLPGLGPGLSWNPPYSGIYATILVGRGGNGWSGSGVSPGGGGGGGQVIDQTGIRFSIYAGQFEPYIIARPNSTDLTNYGGTNASYGGDAINRDGMYSFSVSTGLILYGGIGNTGIGGGGASTTTSGGAGSITTASSQTAGIGGAGYVTRYGTFGAGGGGGGAIKTGAQIPANASKGGAGGGGNGATQGYSSPGVVTPAGAGTDGTGGGGGGGASFSTVGARGGSGAIIIVGKN